MNRVPFEEQETTVEVDYERNAAFVFSSFPKEYRRLKKLAVEYPELVTVNILTGSTIELLVPLDWIKIKPPLKKPWSARNLKGENE